MLSIIPNSRNQNTSPYHNLKRTPTTVQHRLADKRNWRTAERQEFVVEFLPCRFRSVLCLTLARFPPFEHEVNIVDGECGDSVFHSVTAQQVVCGGIDRPVTELGEFGEYVHSEPVEQIPAKCEPSLVHKQNRSDGKECDSLQIEIKPQIVHIVPIDNAQHSEDHCRNEQVLF